MGDGDRVFRKTAAGQAALATRGPGLSARQRSALILVNGREPYRDWAAKMGGDAAELLAALLAFGFVEERFAAAPPPPAPPPAPAPPSAEVLAILAPLKREAVRRLAPQFGPDVDLVCRPLVQAETAEGYRAALAAIETKLAIYLGKGGAKKALDGLWP